MNEYNIEYLNNLILNQVEENLHLDYKAAASLDRQNDKTNEISKDISALANSDGGILIYGIKEDKDNKHLPSVIEPIERKIYSKEWLEQIIQDKIQPRISNFKIYPISIDSETAVYIVEVQKSNTAHQAYDKKYYKRFNFQSTAMYDYEIRDILNRSKNPIILLDFELKNNNTELVFYAKNIGNVYAKYVNIKITIPKKVLKDKYYKSICPDKFEINSENTVRDILDVQMLGFGNTSAKYGPSRYEPILPQQRFELTTVNLDADAFSADISISWKIFCDNSQPIESEIKLFDILTLAYKQ